MNGGGKEKRIAALAESIRAASREERLASREELAAALARLDPTEEEGPAGRSGETPEAEDLDALLAEALAQDGGLAEIRGEEGQAHYHAPALLSRTYAAILAGKSAPCRLMADVVRRNSADYPRPVPLDLFEYPPFDMGPEEIQACLRTLAASPDHGDISFTTTSAGTVYLFSTLHLDRRYAGFLAERVDVGLPDSP